MILKFLKNIMKPYTFVINSKESLQKAAESFGFLPFFPNNVRGLSVEEMCAPGMLFGGNYDEGCWEWKGPVIRKKTSAYGKFFRRKAGFVSLDLLPDFLNYRRKTYPVKKGSTEEMLLEIIRDNDSLSSTELKRLIFGKEGRTLWNEYSEFSNNHTVDVKRKSLESPLQRLQMGVHLVISDFEYKRTRQGERYGWGVARYSTPEINFGDQIKFEIDKTPEESFTYIVTEMKKRFPFLSKSSLEKLLK